MKFASFIAVLMIFCLSPMGELSAFIIKDLSHEIHSIQKESPPDYEEDVEQKIKDLYIADFSTWPDTSTQSCYLSFEHTNQLLKYHPDMETPPPNCCYFSSKRV